MGESGIVQISQRNAEPKLLVNRISYSIKRFAFIIELISYKTWLHNMTFA